ncbi:MAG: hypothetical protein JNJ54_09490 [Myxococcaceae bacterium]|nr:hypothetical protein [Myxococcaceae bacterium]
MDRLLLLTLLLGGTVANAQELHRAPATYFVRGPDLADRTELERWLAGQPKVPAFKLLFTLWRKPRVGVLGAAVVPPTAGDGVRFDDAALGVSLNDRLDALCGPATSCAVWLSGRFGDADGGQRVFRVFAVHEKLAAPGPFFAWAARSPDCLAIVTQKSLHCARGPARCKQCREADARPAKPKLLDLCPWPPEAARPVVELTRGGDTLHLVYDVLETFDDDAKATAFAAQYGLAPPTR